MIEQQVPAVHRPDGAARPRNLVLSFSADRPVSTASGRVAAARLRPGDTMLSGGRAGLTVLSVSFCDGDGAGGGQIVRVLAGRAAPRPAEAPGVPVAGHVSPQDGKLHLRNSPWTGSGQGSLAH